MRGRCVTILRNSCCCCVLRGSHRSSSQFLAHALQQKGQDGETVPFHQDFSKKPAGMNMAANAINSASNIRMDYMKLLIAQMKNQNPLEPLSNAEMASQMAQFSQLEQLEQMNASFAQVLRNVQLNYANSLIDKSVVYADSNGGYKAGKVYAVGTSGDDILLKIGEDDIGLEAVLAIGQ